MNIHLVVVQDFAAHRRGSRITDEAEIAAVLAGEAATKVVRVTSPYPTPSPSPSSRVSSAASQES